MGNYTEHIFFPGAPSNFYAENTSNFIKQNFMMWVFSIFMLGGYFYARRVYEHFVFYGCLIWFLISIHW